ncbi:hypothetical protein HW561_01295 [Rhodobacteraceae bacterium B1Z28]|uniref:DUF6455 domain-containing protein n=2 Tax=Ruegeria haliotis TaxID=2747601 RepID=A0ABX2PMU9_9RHOB|nr:hypothetical protein [Ruegeria haliotis]
MTHLHLVRRMGQATGTDIVAAHRVGHLSQQDWADMIQFCRGCAWAMDCPKWLEENETISDAPKTCPNRVRFATVKARQLRDA